MLAPDRSQGIDKTRDEGEQRHADECPTIGRIPKQRAFLKSHADLGAMADYMERNKQETGEPPQLVNIVSFPHRHYSCWIAQH
jgi:hypothetical protein